MNEQGTKNRGMFISLRVKLLVAFTLLFTAVFAAAYYWFYTFATDTAMRRIEEDLILTLEAAAERVDGEQLVTLFEEGEPREDGFSDDPRYWEQIAWLDTVHHIEPRAWPYTFVRGDDPNEVIFVTDIWSIYDPNKAAPFQYEYIAEDQPEIIVQGLSETTRYLSKTTGFLNIYEDDWGNWVSAYTPVYNAEGEPVAGIGVDFEATYVLQVQQAILNAVVPAFGITYLTLFLLVYLAARVLTRPIRALTQVAARIGEGDYKQNLSRWSKARFTDEITTMAEVFEFMVSKVAEREEKLKEQVAELQIILDEGKRNKQVGEIVDSEFFRALKEKAQNIRSRHTGEGEDAPAVASPGLLSVSQPDVPATPGLDPKSAGD